MGKYETKNSSSVVRPLARLLSRSQNRDYDRSPTSVGINGAAPIWTEHASQMTEAKMTPRRHALVLKYSIFEAPLCQF